MPGSVALRAERNEIFVGVVAQFAARREVVNLKIFRSSTALAAPAVALEHLAAQPSIGFRLKP
jgi:hypothetical protein